MVFTLLVAADLHGTKTNYEIEFGMQPSIPELHRRLEHVFGTEHQMRAPPSHPGIFAIDRMQIFDERVELWVDLLSSTQLQDFSQIYVFQPETMWHKEVQSKLPPAVRAPNHAAAMMGTPRRSPTGMRSASGISQMMPIGMVPVPMPMPVAVAAPAPLPAILRSGADATHEEKVSMVFDEMDTRKIRSLDIGEFQAFLTNLQFEFSVNTMADLFSRADANRDGTVSYPEFQRFSERYPTLLDAMHYRAREYWQDVHQREAIDAARRLLDSLRAREIDARAATAQAIAESAAQEGRLAAQMQAVAEAEAKEREALAILDAARQETERARAEVAARCAEEAAARDVERAKQLAHVEVVREVEAAEARLRGQEAEQIHAEERMRDIERMLMEQQREVEAQRNLCARARADLNAMQGLEQQAAMVSAEANRDVQMASERLSLAKSDLARAQDRERDCTAAHLGAREACAHQKVQREREEQELLICREREAARKAVEAESVRAVEAQEAMCRSLEHENLEHAAQRAKVQTEEAPLIDQEVRLREQRDALEMREAVLRDEAGAFNARNTVTRGVASPRSLQYQHAVHNQAALNLAGISPDRSPRRLIGSPLKSNFIYGR
ncbi:calmodulin-like protein containing EF hand domain [Diplonema papillatum]|nr:calmodulin-like protein containing EF hand domain [Diplonema papillatum]